MRYFKHLRGDTRLGRRRSPFHAVHRAVAGLGFAESATDSHRRQPDAGGGCAGRVDGLG